MTNTNDKGETVERKQEQDKHGGASRKANGQLLPGHTANRAGRPKAMDFRRVCEEKAREEGYDLESAIWAVLKDQLEKAKNRKVTKMGNDGKWIQVTVEGDTKAAQLVLDRICGPMKHETDINVNQTVVLTNTERVVRLKQLLDKAKGPEVTVEIGEPEEDTDE